MNSHIDGWHVENVQCVQLDHLILSFIKSHLKSVFATFQPQNLLEAREKMTET